MHRKVALLIPVLLAAVVPALPASAAPVPPAPGWTVAGDVIQWSAPAPLPLSDAGVEFWEGDRFLGLARESANLRTFTLTAPLKDRGALQVRSAGRRLDVTPPAPPASPVAPELPALLPAAATDPGTPGPYGTTKGEYKLDPIKLPDYAAPIEMEAVVVAPKGVSGKRLLALFLHGRHFTCYSKTIPNRISIDWPCPADMTAVPSHRGYLKAQELLASQGYVTVSISANGINAQDALTVDAGAQGRSSLVRHHLAKWADWSADLGSAPDAVQAAPADLSKVLLVGHSRGGEGVNRAATDSLTPPPGDTGFTGPVRWTIRGDVLIGPTIFGHNPAPDVPSVTFLPGCDGDVSDLQGQMFVDQTRGVSRDTALHSALYMVGANHNYFNSEWTPGQAEAPASDDFHQGQPDAVCSVGTPTRLTADQQQTMGATYIAASAQLFLARDESVLPLLDGSGVRAPSADPARVRSHAVGGDRRSFVVPDASTQASGSARVCSQVTRDPAAACAPRSPHFVGFRGAVAQPERLSVALKWSAAGDAGVVRPAEPLSLHGSRSLALRLAVPPNSPATGFDVTVTDQNGQKRSLGSVSVAGLPGTDRSSALWAQEVRVPLPSDLGRVAALELVPESASGQAWLIDAYGWNKGLVPVVPARLARVDATVTSVLEGDSGTQTHNIAVTASGNGNGTRTIRLFFTDQASQPATRLVTLKPGEHRTDVPVSFTGNTRWGADTRYPVTVQAIDNAVVGAAFGGLLVRNDDPVPSVKVTPVAESVTEGGTLTWKVTLSEVADTGVIVVGLPAAPAGAAELSTTDVDAQWLMNNSGEEALPSRPLSSTGLELWVYIAPGQTSADFTVPTVADTEAEGAEQVRLQFTGRQPTGSEFEVTGKVADAA